MHSKPASHIRDAGLLCPYQRSDAAKQHSSNGRTDCFPAGIAINSDCTQKNSFSQKSYNFSLEIEETALYLSIKCSNPTESQGIEEPSFGTYALFLCYHMLFYLKQREIRTFRHNWFLCFQAVKGTFKGTEQPRFSLRFDFNPHLLLSSCPLHRHSNRREGHFIMHNDRQFPNA